MTRQEIIDLIHNEYDTRPAQYRLGDDWDDGAGRVADGILADRMLLHRQYTACIEALEAVLRAAVNDLEYLGYPVEAKKARAALDKDAGVGCGKSVIEPWSDTDG